MILALLLFTTPFNVDKLTPKDLAKISHQGKVSYYQDILHQSLKTMLADAENGEYCSDLFFHNENEVRYVYEQLSPRGFKISNNKSPTLNVCWN